MNTTVTDDQLSQLQRRQIPWIIVHEHADVIDATKSSDQRKLIFPGSFNPLHIGHREMANYAQRVKRSRVIFELSIVNVDKPELPAIEVRRRLSQFDVDQAVCLTCAPRFTDKAALFPGSRFIVGADTVVRIGDDRYYEDQSRIRDRAIEQLHESRIRFLVFGRLMNGSFESVDDLRLPRRLQQLCDPVSETDFRRDISSTELRET